MENITESNRIIAEFMGITETKLDVFGAVVTPNNTLIKYHTSWDWLMPIVEKIETMPMPNGKQNYITVEFDNRPEFIGWYFHVENGNKTIKSFDDRLKTKIEATYQAVIHFINWYNLQNK